MFYVKVSDAMGDEWRPYKTLSEAQAYALAIDGEVYQDAKDNTTNLMIDNAVTAYLEKKKKHITVRAM
jgi:hypothetical protein